MDAIDQAIARLLERHGRLSQERLARRVRAVAARRPTVQATMTILALSSPHGTEEPA